MVQIIACPFCERKLDSETFLIQHAKQWHKTSLMSICYCRYEGCCRILKNFYSYKRHIFLTHLDHKTEIYQIKNSDINNSLTKLGNLARDLTTENRQDRLKSECLVSDPTSLTIIDFESIVQTEISSFVSQIYSEFNITRTFVSTLIDKIKNLYNLTFIPILKRRCNSENYKEALSDLTKMFTILQHGFDNFKSDYSNLKYFENANTLIKPQSFTVHTLVNSRLSGGKRKAVISDAHINVISIKMVLKTFLEIPTVFTTILKHIEQCRANTSIVSNLQGELWQNIEKQFEGKTLFPLILYFDDIEINNPLGSHANIRKLGAVYFSLACIPFQFSSLLENIFLAQLHHTKDQKLAGNKKIFQNIIEQLTDLEVNGLIINLDGKKQTVYFSLLVVIGDNLAMNDICGFTTSFNTQNICRICTADKIESRKQVAENPLKLRTKENYLQDCENRSMGVKTECVFNKIPKFHVIENAYLDPMHDLFEGISSEMVFLIKHLGILIGDLVPINNKVWEVYIILQEIINIIMSSTITVATTHLLENLISEHHSLYIEIFEESLKPKHHFIIHYPRLLRRLGPLKHLSCFRYEAKHKQLKEYAKVVRSRTNSPYTLALKHQLNLSHRFRIKKGFLDRFNLGPALCKELDNLPDFLYFKDILPLNFQYEYILNTWIEVNGIRYYKNMAVAITQHLQLLLLVA
ncbi:uncharacterized protein [Cardiocondyla obscurior]|uniref:uncharacterized protein n=1 Tax=Cardiocondyla obscurior TaxID=286306 RepID=UPI0039655DD4